MGPLVVQCAATTPVRRQDSPELTVLEIDDLTNTGREHQHTITRIPRMRQGANRK